MTAAFPLGLIAVGDETPRGGSEFGKLADAVLLGALAKDIVALYRLDDR